MGIGFKKRWVLACSTCSAKISSENTVCNKCRRPLLAVSVSGKTLIGCARCGTNFANVTCGTCKTQNSSEAAELKSASSFLSKVAYTFVGLVLLGAVLPRSNKNDRSNTSPPSTVQETATLVSPAPTQQADSASMQRPAVAPKAKTLRLSVAEIVRRTESNELRFRDDVKKAGGLAFSGKVTKIEAGMLWSGPTLQIATSNEFLPITAVLKSDQKDRAIKLDAGERVELVCQNPTSLMGVALYDCELR